MDLSKTGTSVDFISSWLASASLELSEKHSMDYNSFSIDVLALISKNKQLVSEIQIIDANLPFCELCELFPILELSDF